MICAACEKVNGPGRKFCADCGSSLSAWVEVEVVLRGTYLEIERPTRLVNTWLFEGWPDAWATETSALSEAGNVTTLTLTSAFRDKAGAANMLRAHADAARRGDANGLPASLDAMEDLLASLVERASAPRPEGATG